jgi:aspartate/methionine/tyrosine aminotransferase
MFSSRLSWSFVTNRLSTLLEAKRAAGAQILDLTESNPTHAGFDYPRAEILEALSPSAALRYEPDPRGLATARQAIADYYNSRGDEVSAESLHLTASTSEAYAYLFKLFANPGDEVLVPQPSYPLFEFLAALESIHVARYPLKYDHASGWGVDLETLANMISTKTRAIIIVNPNNPTGSFVKKNELVKLNEICIEHDLALIVDEVFSDYVNGNDARRVRSLARNRQALTFVLSGLSKICGLPQMKLGWIHTSGPERLVAEARDRLDFISDTYLSVSTPIQHATPALLALREEIQAQIIDRVSQNDAFLRARSAELPICRVLKREGGWYSILGVSGEFLEEDFCVSLLEADNVLLHPGYFFDFTRQGFLVFSLLAPAAIFEEGATRVLRRLREIRVGSRGYLDAERSRNQKL